MGGAVAETMCWVVGLFFENNATLWLYPFFSELYHSEAYKQATRSNLIAPSITQVFTVPVRQQVMVSFLQFI